MTPNRVAVIIALATLLSATALMQFAQGMQTPAGLAEHFLLALVAAWVGVTIVASVLTGYSVPQPAPAPVDDDRGERTAA